jgi:hypothetical protein
VLLPYDFLRYITNYNLSGLLSRLFRVMTMSDIGVSLRVALTKRFTSDSAGYATLVFAHTVFFLCVSEYGFRSKFWDRVKVIFFIEKIILRLRNLRLTAVIRFKSTASQIALLSVSFFSFGGVVWRTRPFIKTQSCDPNLVEVAKYFALGMVTSSALVLEWSFLHIIYSRLLYTS